MQIVVEVPDAVAAELSALWAEPLDWKAEIVALWAEKAREMAELAVRTAYVRESQKDEPDGAILVAVTVREKNLSRVTSILTIAKDMVIK